MRKIWITIPFGQYRVGMRLFDYTTRINALCTDVTFGMIESLCNEPVKYEVTQYSNIEYRIYKEDSKRLICIVKQIEIDMQDFPTTPNANIGK